MNGSEMSVLKQISAKLKTSSAVVPALLAALISMTIGVVGLVYDARHENLYSICLIAPLLILLMQISFFTVFDRDRLHNEEHIERRMIIDQERSVIGDNGNKRQITLDSKELIGNYVGGGKSE